MVLEPTDENNFPVAIFEERPDTPEALALIRSLDAYLDALYTPEGNFGVSVAALLQPEVSFFVARLSGTAVGCVAMERFSDYAELKRMFVAPEARRQGIGQALLGVVATTASCEGIFCLRLETGAAQTEALALYEKSGYVVTTPFGAWADHPDPNSVYFEKILLKK